MNERLLELATRRGELTARIAMQREAIAANTYPLEILLTGADQAAAGVDWLKRRPAIIAGAVALLVALRPGRLLRWGQRGILLWRAVHALRSKLKGLL